MTAGRQEPGGLPAPRFAHIDRAEFERLQRLAGPDLVYRVVADGALERRFVSPWVGNAQLRSTEEVLASSLLGFLPPEDRPPVQALTVELLEGRVADATIVVGCLLGDGRLVPAAIRTTYVVSRDERLFDSTVAILDPERMPDAATNPLTPRQTEILRLLADGIATGDIAVRLHLSRTTVRNHIAHLCAALGARSRLEAVAIARARGILD